jgi:hypothetical protein
LCQSFKVMGYLRHCEWCKIAPLCASPSKSTSCRSDAEASGKRFQTIDTM